MGSAKMGMSRLRTFPTLLKRLSSTIARGEISPPDWPLPAGFPDPQAPVRALHRGSLAALLRERGDRLERVADLGGI